MNLQTAIHDMNTFLAYAITMEEEASEKYDELAEALETHDISDVANTFHTLARLGRRHAEEIISLARGLELPNIEPWDFGWEDTESAEATSLDAMRYLQNSSHALNIAVDNEQRAYDFYYRVSQDTENPEIRKLAEEFAKEEQEHLTLLKQWAEKYRSTSEDWRVDPDSANIPAQGDNE